MCPSLGGAPWVGSHLVTPGCRVPRSQRYALSVVSLSPQSLASVAAFYGVTVPVAYAKLEAFFTSSLGVDCVVDTGAGVDLALIEVHWRWRRCDVHNTPP